MVDTTQEPLGPSEQELEAEIAQLRCVQAVRSLLVLESLKGFEITTSNPNGAALATRMNTIFGDGENSQLVDRVYEISTGYYTRAVKMLEGEIAELENDRSAEEMLAFDSKLEVLKREMWEQQHELRKLYSKWNEMRSEREW
jgi:hypothetical protein